MAPTDHAVPRHLGAPSRAWLRHLLDAYTFSPSEWSLAVLAAEARDRAATARRQLGREGLTIVSPFGELKPHPRCHRSRLDGALLAPTRAARPRRRGRRLRWPASPAQAPTRRRSR
jgi:hypothetical protein